jgi:hypothetical protein
MNCVLTLELLQERSIFQPREDLHLIMVTLDPLGKIKHALFYRCGRFGVTP